MSPFGQSAPFRPVGPIIKGALISSKQFDAGLAPADVDKTARHQSIAFEDFSVVFHTDFVFGTAFEIIEYDLGQAPLGEVALVFDVDRFRGHGELRQNRSARVGTSIRVGACEPSANVSACIWVVRWITNYWTRGSLIRNDAPP
jgi:hypothetical protein